MLIILDFLKAFSKKKTLLNHEKYLIETITFEYKLTFKLTN